MKYVQWLVEPLSLGKNLVRDFLCLVDFGNMAGGLEREAKLARWE